MKIRNLVKNPIKTSSQKLYLTLFIILFNNLVSVIITKRMFLFSLFFLIFFTTIGQEFRLNLKKIEQEFASKKTVGEQIEYYRNLAKDCERNYGVRSYEYLATQTTFLDIYDALLPNWIRDTTKILDTLIDERKKLIPITRELFGCSSFQYASAVIHFGLLSTNVWNRALTANEKEELLSLFKEALDSMATNSLYSEIDKNKWIVNLLIIKAAIYRKSGEIDQLRIHLDSILSIVNKYNFTTPKFNVLPTTLLQYATFVLKGDIDSQINLLDKYDSLVWNNYKTEPRTLLDYRNSTLSHRIAGKRIDQVTTRHFIEADSLCQLIYTVNSHEYVIFLLNVSLPILKNIGFKSQVFQTLSYLEDILKKKDLFTTKDGLVSQYYLEWYKYFASIGEEEEGVKYLYMARKYADISLNRSTFETSINIIRSLKDYYRFRNIDSCFDYAFQLIHLQERARDYWGDRPIHEYHELAKLILSTESKELMPHAREYIDKALKTFENNYGLGSIYYKAALFTLGQYELQESNYKNGLDKCWASVYDNLNNNIYVPNLEMGLFDAYAEIMQKLNIHDSADLFNEQTLYRNIFLNQMNIVGFDESLQLQAIKNIKNEQSYILSNHLKRSNSSDYDQVNRDLANFLTSKNLSLRLQKLYQNSIEFAKSNKIEYYDSYRFLSLQYDSLINTGNSSNTYLDTLYQKIQSNKGWMLEKYYFSLTQEDQNRMEETYSHSYNWIQAQLGDDDVFIDISEFKIHDRQMGYSNTPSYAFFLLDKKTGTHIQYYFLKEPKALQENIFNQQYDTLSVLLKDLISRIGPYKKCIIHADGLLSQLNFGALSDESGAFLINKKTFFYISNRSAIKRLDLQSPKAGEAVFMGNPSYRIETKETNKGVFPRNLATKQLELPYTRQEILETSSILQKAGWSTKIAMDTSLNEKNIRKLSKPTLLHIATHGFYIDNETGDDNDVMANQKNTYLKSGLILSAPKEKYEYDNLLSSFEIMNLNWSGVSLAVLSACQTARGELMSGEGVFGIQRALQVSGVNQMIITTHNVYDKSTQILMKYFYEAIPKTKTYAEALTNAQRKMTKENFYSKPKHWAPFILIQN